MSGQETFTFMAEQMPKKPIAVLGCGPAGLLAAHAAALTGNAVVIFSKPEKSRLGGAQFLHEPIPEVTDNDPDITITYRRSGNGHMYQHKAYGNGAQPGFVSFDGVEDGLEQPGWNLIKAYDRLWNDWGDSITDATIDGEWLQQDWVWNDFAFVVSTIPLRSLCLRRHPEGDMAAHRFTEQRIVVAPGVCHGGFGDNTIWYDGSKDHSWYRSSRLFGVEFTEWGMREYDRLPYQPAENMVLASKPLDTDCKCHRLNPNFIPVGRFGRWRKGILVHDAFRTTVVELHKRGYFEMPERIRP